MGTSNTTRPLPIGATRLRYFALAVLLMAITAVYTNSFHNGFHFDDFHTVIDNPAVRSLRNLPRIFRDTTAFSVLPANQTYRPMVTASLALDYALGHGYEPFWFHLSTYLWFLVLVVSLLLWSEAVFDSTEKNESNRWLALAVAGWFGLHPVMAETVNYIIQRGDLYCTLGCVGALALYARSSRARRYGLYLLPFILAMLSKPPAAVFPVLLFLQVLLFGGEKTTSQRWWTALRSSAPAAGLTALLLWFQAAMTPKSYTPSILSAWAYRLTQPYVWLRYVGSLFLPLHLNVDTDLQPFSTFGGRALAGILFALSILTIALLSARRRRTAPIALGLLWFVTTQLPTSLYTLSEVENDHRMFFSFPGLMLAAVWSLHLLVRQISRLLEHRSELHLPFGKICGVLSVFVLAAYAFGAHERNMVWHDEGSLWADDVVKCPQNGRGLMNYGLTRMAAGAYSQARSLFARALQLTPNYPTLEINLGVVNGAMADAGQPALAQVAEQHFRRALLLASADDLPHAYYGRWLLAHKRVDEAVAQLQVAMGLNPQRSMQRNLLLQAYAEAGDSVRARALAADTLRVDPGNTAAAYMLQTAGGGKPTEADNAVDQSLAAYRAGDFQGSLTAAQRAVQLNPKSAAAWNNVGAALGGMHRWQEAAKAEEHAVELDPQLLIARNNLQWFHSEMAPAFDRMHQRLQTTANDQVNASLRLNQQGKYQESIAAAREALRLDPKVAEAWNNIAAGEEALHHWDAAIDAAQHALALRPDFQLARNNLSWSMQQKKAGHR